MNHFFLNICIWNLSKNVNSFIENRKWIHNIQFNQIAIIMLCLSVLHWRISCVYLRAFVCVYIFVRLYIYIHIYLYGLKKKRIHQCYMNWFQPEYVYIYLLFGIVCGKLSAMFFHIPLTGKFILLSPGYWIAPPFYHPLNGLTYFTNVYSFILLLFDFSKQFVNLFAWTFFK